MMTFVSVRRPRRRVGRRARTAGLFLLWLVPAVAGSQPGERLTEQRVRALTRQSAADARGDATKLVLSLDRRVRERWGDFESFPISIVRREDVLVTLTTPYMAYRLAVADHLRLRRPLRDVPWTDAAVVVVSPERIGGPDIQTVAVSRDGREVPPLRDRLRPMTFTNGNGETSVMHAGEVQFPMAAFAPGSLVTVSARRLEGGPFLYTFSASELQALK
jgi:hypothetical protein